MNSTISSEAAVTKLAEVGLLPSDPQRTLQDLRVVDEQYLWDCKSSVESIIKQAIVSLEVEWCVPFERDATTVKAVLVWLRCCYIERPYIQQELFPQIHREIEIKFGANWYNTRKELRQRVEIMAGMVNKRLNNAQRKMVAKLDCLQAASAECSLCDMNEARATEVQKHAIELEKELAVLKSRYDQHLRHLEERECKLTNLEKDNGHLREKIHQLELKLVVRDDQLECKRTNIEEDHGDLREKAHQLELKLAVMEERCDQMNHQVKTLTEENMRLRGELGELIGNFKLALMSSTMLRDSQLAPEADLQARNTSKHLMTRQSYQPFLGCASDGGSNGSWRVFYDPIDLPMSLSSAISEKSSSISVGTHDPQCFLADAVFTTTSGDIEFLLPARELSKGSIVLAANGETKLEVIGEPEMHKSDTIIEIQAGGATLSVTKDHRIPIVRHGVAGEVLAGSIEKDDLVYVDKVATSLTSVQEHALCEPVEVVKIAFNPDMPVAAFTRPLAISSKGYRKKAPRRSGMNKRGESETAQMSRAACSVPDTAPGEYKD